MIVQVGLIQYKSTILIRVVSSFSELSTRRNTYIYIPQKQKYRYSKKIELIKEAINHIRELRYFVLEIPKNISSTLTRALPESTFQMTSSSALLSVLEIFLGISSTKYLISLM